MNDEHTPPETEPDADAAYGTVDDETPVPLEEGEDWPEPAPEWEASEAHDDPDRSEGVEITEGEAEPGARALTAYLNGFSISSRPSSIGVKSYRVPGTQVYLPVRTEIAPLLIGAASEFHRTVEPLVRGWCWGYAYRAVTAGRSWSFHAPGVAVDLNAPKHPYGRRGTFSPSDMTRCRAIARKYGLRWGGDYRTRADEMHFEVIVPRATALAMVRRLQTPPRPTVRPPTLRRGDSGAWVRTLQANYTRYWRRYAVLTVDGDFGPKTEAAVRELQRKGALVEDGIVGPKTWAKLGYR